VIGLVLLGFGFVFQAGGYIAVIGRAPLQTGAGRAAVAALLLVLAGAVAFAAGLIAHRRLLRRMVVRAARVEPTSGRVAKYPEGKTLLQFGQELGLVIEGNPTDPPVIDAFAKRHFGVERVSWQWRDPPPLAASESGRGAAS
jgi:hypothetical protein